MDKKSRIMQIAGHGIYSNGTDVKVLPYGDEPAEDGWKRLGSLDSFYCCFLSPLASPGGCQRAPEWDVPDTLIEKIRNAVANLVKEWCELSEGLEY